MKGIKAFAWVCLLIAALASGLMWTEAEEVYPQNGDPMDDFSVHLCDGRDVMLSELWNACDAVVVYFWQDEYDASQMAEYQDACIALGDRVKMLALATEYAQRNYRNDAELAAFQEKNRLTGMLMGGVEKSVSAKYAVGLMDAGVIVDRFGVIVDQASGGYSQSDWIFEKLSHFVGEDYAESTPLDGYGRLPKPAPAEPSPEALARALNAEGSELTFSRAEEGEWREYGPFLPGEKGAVPAALGSDYECSGIQTELTAKAGEVLSFRLTMDTVPGENMLYVFVNDEEVGARSGRIEDGVFAYEFPEDGEYCVRVEYLSDEETDWEETMVIYDFALLSGEEAQSALDAVPRQIKSLPEDEVELILLDEHARRVELSGEDSFYWCDYYEGVEFYVMSEEIAEFKLKLGEDCDAFRMRFYTNGEERNQGCATAFAVDDEGYFFRTRLNRVENGDGCCTSVGFNENAGLGWRSGRSLLLFANEENLNYYCRKYLPAEWAVNDAQWRYVDGSPRGTEALPAYEGLNVGDEMPDFETELIDGATFRLSEALRSHDAVVVYFWDTENDDEYYMRDFQQAIGEFGDSVAYLVFVAGNAEIMYDKPEEVRAYQQIHGCVDLMMSYDRENLRDRMGFIGKDSWVLVDRFGVICYLSGGGRYYSGWMRNLLVGYVGEDYAESTFDYRESYDRPTTLRGDAAALSAALNAEGGTIAFSCVDDLYVWPFLPVEGGVSPASLGEEDTIAEIRTEICAQAGDTLCFRLQMDTLPSYSELSVFVNDERVGRRSGKVDEVFACEFAADGLYRVSLRYDTQKKAARPESVVLSDFTVMKGKPAESAAEPIRTLTEEKFTLALLNENARRMEIIPAKSIAKFNDKQRRREFYILPTDEAQVLLRLGEKIDANCLQIRLSNGEPQNYTTAQLKTEEGYVFRVPVDSLADGGDCYTEIMLYEYIDDYYYRRNGFVLFTDEENLDYYCKVFLEDEVGGAEWKDFDLETAQRTGMTFADMVALGIYK